MSDEMSATGRSAKLAVVILTKNEAIDIAACIESCRFADAVIVVDSDSDDETRPLAIQAGAEVHVHPFVNYAEQRNAGLRYAGNYDWVLMVDADERVPTDLACEIRTVIEESPHAFAAYRIRRKDFFLGRWLRRSSGYPTWFGRLMRPTKSRFVRDINEDLEVDGKTGYCRNHLVHYPFSKGVAAWIQRHNVYSTMEAHRLSIEKSCPLEFSVTAIYDPSSRRKLAKQLFYRLPFRPLLAFLGLYVVRGGFLDGVAGWHYCRLRSVYEYFICLKTRELSEGAVVSPGSEHTDPD